MNIQYVLDESTDGMFMIYFQTFCGILKRTILLDDIKDIEDEEDLQDHLEIHFQKPSNYGGEIDSIKYVSKGNVLQAFFSEDMERGN